MPEEGARDILAASIDKYGELDAIQWRRRRREKLKKGEVRIRVEAWGVCHADVVMLKGYYYAHPKPPVTAGMEIAGTIIDVGSENLQFWIGRRVGAYVEYGGFAEEVDVGEEGLFVLPDEMPVTIGCWLPMTYGTAWIALRQRGGAKKGETALIIGCSGNIGFAAVELAREWGLKVIGTSGDEKKRQRLEKKVGFRVINNTMDGWSDEVIKETGGSGVDLVIDMVGGELSGEYIRATRTGGRVVAVGFAGGRVQRYSAAEIVMRELTIVGSSWTGMWKRAPERIEQIWNELKKMYEEKKITPRIDEIMGKEEIAYAIKKIVNREANGKIILVNR